MKEWHWLAMTVLSLAVAAAILRWLARRGYLPAWVRLSPSMRLVFLNALYLGLAAGLAARIATCWVPFPWMLNDPLVYFPMLGWFLTYGLALTADGLLAARRCKIQLLPLLPLVACFALDVHWGRPVAVSADRRPLHLLTYNIHRGQWAEEAILDYVEQAQPDVFFAQEVPSELYERWRPRLDSLFRHHVFFDEILVAVNLDVVAVQRVNLSGARRLLALTVTQDGHRLIVANTHLSTLGPLTFLDRVRKQRAETAALLDALGNLGDPVVLGGDFNLPRRATCYRRLTRRFHSAAESVYRGFGYTFPSPMPVTMIDHVFGDDAIEFVGMRIGRTWLSDHFPVHVEFRAPTHGPTRTPPS